MIVLADQESLTDESIASIKRFVKDGGGLVMTGNTGKFDGWRRLRKISLLMELLPEDEQLSTIKLTYGGDPVSINYGKGKVIYLPSLRQPSGEVKLGMESVWMMPENANELSSAIYRSAANPLPLKVNAPQWIGVSHDSGENREIIHLFNYTGKFMSGNKRQFGSRMEFTLQNMLIGTTDTGIDNFYKNMVFF